VYRSTLTEDIKMENSYNQLSAKLIAAAPDLLKALKDFVEIQDPDSLAEHAWNDCGGPESCVYCQAKAAIAKAEGDSTIDDTQEMALRDALEGAGE
jgi:hypothetical protein